ncbi:MAG TPA: phosphate ABC transporter substrate-binding protein PstS [Propionibacteriaceae bacterium]|nr:phosphate ABC transporter substrate-binding protein PstS [Propionibacteriaceae bacterium]
MSNTRVAKLAALAAIGALSLAACSSTSASNGGNASADSASGSSLACPSGSITAEGSTAQANAIQQIIASYGDACKNKAKIEYNGTGSGAGIKNFNAALVDFAGSDSALSAAEHTTAKARCQGNDALDLPMVVGPVAFSYNVKGVSKLTLNADTIAQIFMGKITTWNDPAIAALNSGVTLPSTKISVFYRSDDSGTTDNVSNYLHTAAPSSWTAAHSKTWKGQGGEGKNGSSGVAQAVTSTDGGFGYLEWSYALDNKLGIAQIDTGSGPVALTADSVGKALEAAKITGTGNDLTMQLDYATKAAGAYPAVLVTYEIVCSAGLDSAKTAIVKDFLTYFASADGQKSLQDVGSAPLPASLRDKVNTSIQAIK